MKNSDRFLDCYSKIERHLRHVTGEDRLTSFTDLVRIAARSNRAVRRYQGDLREYASLRNCIVHERAGGQVIAEPLDVVVEHLDEIANILLNPPNLESHFLRPVKTVRITDTVDRAVKVMLDEAYSQIPAYSGSEFVGLLTENTVARWLGSCVHDIFDPTDTTIEHVLQFAEHPDDFVFLSRSATLFDAAECFRESQQRGRKLEAILITHKGKRTESLLGIITIWDLPQVYRAITLPGWRARIGG